MELNAKSGSTNALRPGQTFSPGYKITRPQVSGHHCLQPRASVSKLEVRRRIDKSHRRLVSIEKFRIYQQGFRMIRTILGVVSLVGMAIFVTSMAPAILSDTPFSELKFQVSNLSFEPIVYVSIFCSVLFIAQKFEIWWAIGASLPFLALGLLPIFSDGHASAIEKRISSLETELQAHKVKADGFAASAVAQIERLGATKVNQCRICFRETEGGIQCQRNRASCSGWSEVGSTGAWTQPFRDDTDNRSGGCVYQWRLECK